MRVMTAVGLVALLVAAPLTAQSVGERAFDDVERVVEGIGRVWSSPARMEARDMEGVGAAVAATALIALVDQPIQDALRAMEDGPLVILKPFREPSFISTLGLSKQLITLSGGLWAAGVLAGSSDLRDAGTGCVVADISNTIARHLIARVLNRARPQEARGPYVARVLGPGEWEMRSFPGGHGANITACTTFWTRRFDLGVAEPAMWALAGAISLSRVVDEAHWASDALFGVIFGHAIGATVADRYLDRLTPDGGEPVLTERRSTPSLALSVRVPLP